MADDNDLIHSIEKDIQREKWLALWKRYGLILSIGLILITLGSGTGGYLFYKSRLSQDHASSHLLKALTLADLANNNANNNADNKDNWQPLEAFLDSQDTKWPLHTLTSTLTLARHYALEGKTDKLLTLLNTTPPTNLPYYDDILTLWKGKALTLKGQYDEAILLLNPLAQGTNSWRYIALEWLAEIALNKNDIHTAKLHLQTISDDIQAPQPLRKRASRMLKVLS